MSAYKAVSHICLTIIGSHVCFSRVSVSLGCQLT